MSSSDGIPGARPEARPEARPGPRRRGAFALLVRVVVFALLFGGLAEVWFRVVMPACQSPVVYQQDPETMYRYDPYRLPTGLFTVGRLCRPAGEWSINAAGWNADLQYASPDERRQQPMIALLGDSYVEGLLTDTDQHVDAYIRRMLPAATTYAFGASGWYLEQYVATLRYVSPRFGRPAVIVVLVNDRDVRDSIRNLGVVSAYWWQIEQSESAGDAGFAEAGPLAVRVTGRLQVLSKRFALVNYLRYNAQLTLPGMRGGGPGTGAAQPVAQEDLAAEGGAAVGADNAWRALLPAAEYLVGQLCAQNPGTPVVLAADGYRYYSPAVLARAPLSSDQRALNEASKDNPQCTFIDLREVFTADWARNHVEFEAVDGGHWNPYANRLVARTLVSVIRQKGLLEQ